MPNRIGHLVEDLPISSLRDSSKGHRDPISHHADYDGEFRFELFLLDDGQKKVEQKDETRKPILS
jgi:DNA-directed RNA polymerase II subunit RPB11